MSDANFNPPKVTFPINFNLIRKTFANEIQKVTGITAMLEEPEAPNQPRPPRPYFSFKLINPADKSGDDSKQNVLDEDGNETSVWNSGGVRKMTVSFHCYARDHEEAYNYMGLWQAALDLENIQSDLRQAGIAVWVIGNVADLTKLLNTGFEGRSHMDCTFGIASNIQSDLGYMDAVRIDGAINTDKEIVQTSITVEE